MGPKQKLVADRVEDGFSTVFEGAQQSAEREGLNFAQAQASMLSGAVSGMCNQIMALAMTVGGDPKSLAEMFAGHVVEGVGVIMASDVYKSAAGLVDEFKRSGGNDVSELARSLEAIKDGRA